MGVLKVEHTIISAATLCMLLLPHAHERGGGAQLMSNVIREKGFMHCGRNMKAIHA